MKQHTLPQIYSLTGQEASMLVELGSMWRVDASFPAVSPEPVEHREQIESGSLVLVIGESFESVPPRVKLSLCNHTYWAYERDIIGSARRVS